MNNPFLNRLANILDGLPPYQLSHEANSYDAYYRNVEHRHGYRCQASP